MVRYRKAIVIFLIGACIFSISTGKIYAMGQVKSKIKEAMESSNPQQYEINIILMDLGIKDWRCPSDASDEIDNPVDEPLGEYSPEELQKYTDRKLEVEIDYGYGCLWEGKNKERFIQVIRIYENGELQSCSYTGWNNGYIDGGGARLKNPRIS